MTLRIERKDSPQDADYQAILAPLRAYNQAQADLPNPQTIAWVVNDDTGNACGGLYGRTFGHWLFIELLAVPQAARGQGLGAQLMAQAEAWARANGCVGIWLDTFSFQAPTFYRRLGFSVFGELADYPPGHTRHFLYKRLDGAAA